MPVAMVWYITCEVREVTAKRRQFHMNEAAREFSMSARALNPLTNLDRVANSIDRSIGSRLRAKRVSAGMSQTELAEKLQIDPVDVQAYEDGTKRISALSLLRLAEALGVRPIYFFDPSVELPPVGPAGGKRPSSGPEGIYLASPDQGVRLNRSFVGIKDSSLREAIVTLVAGLAKVEATR